MNFNFLVSSGMLLIKRFSNFNIPQFHTLYLIQYLLNIKTLLKAGENLFTLLNPISQGWAPRPRRKPSTFALMAETRQRRDLSPPETRRCAI